MQQLIEKLLFLARADQRRLAVNMEDVDLEELLADTMEKMHTVTTTHEVSLGRNDPAIVRADPVLLRQLLRIFLENSVKYTPPGGHISAESIRSEDGKSVTVQLSDDGIGIAPNISRTSSIGSIASIPRVQRRRAARGSVSRSRVGSPINTASRSR